jgi:hypothetical protein
VDLIVIVPRGTLIEGDYLGPFRKEVLALFHVEQFSANGDNWPLNGDLFGLNGHFLLAKDKHSAGICWLRFKWTPVKLGGFAGFGLEGWGVFVGGEDG